MSNKSVVSHSDFMLPSNTHSLFWHSTCPFFLSYLLPLFASSHSVVVFGLWFLFSVQPLVSLDLIELFASSCWPASPPLPLQPAPVCARSPVPWMLLCFMVEKRDEWLIKCHLDVNSACLSRLWMQFFLFHPLIKRRMGTQTKAVWWIFEHTYNRMILSILSSLLSLLPVLSGHWGGVRRWSSVTAGRWTRTEPWWGKQWRTVWGPLLASCSTWHTTTVSRHTEKHSSVKPKCQTSGVSTVCAHFLICVCRVGQYEDRRTGWFNSDGPQLCSESPPVSPTGAEVRYTSVGESLTQIVKHCNDWIYIAARFDM